MTERREKPRHSFKLTREFKEVSKWNPRRTNLPSSRQRCHRRFERRRLSAGSFGLGREGAEIHAANLRRKPRAHGRGRSNHLSQKGRRDRSDGRGNRNTSRFPAQRERYGSVFKLLIRIRAAAQRRSRVQPDRHLTANARLVKPQTQDARRPLPCSGLRASCVVFGGGRRDVGIAPYGISSSSRSSSTESTAKSASASSSAPP